MYYPFDVTPSLWNFLKSQFDKDILFANDKVIQELVRNDDDLTTWVKASIKKEGIVDTKKEPEIINHYSVLMSWANSHPGYNSIAVKDFAKFSNADPWLVAGAVEKELTVVSQEISSPQSQNIIKLPDACLAFDVRHINTISFLRELHFSM